MPHSASAEQILDMMHSAILSADFAALAALTPNLETAVSAAETARDLALLRRISAKANRNAACLLAAGRGVRAAQRRIAELRDAARGFATYDGQGRRAQHDVSSHVSRRY